nr:single-stranded DNA-binding protein [Bacillus cereus]
MGVTQARIYNKGVVSMGIRETLKKREEQREANQNGGNNDFPEGVTRYVRMGKRGEVNADGRTFILLADPDNWYFYFVHEDKTFDGKRTIHRFRKHSCLHSPRETDADITQYFKPGKTECPSCRVGAKRKMYAMIPVYDLEYTTYRVIDTAEFHINNIIADYDKAEKMGRKFNPEYSLVGEAVHFKQVDKSYSLESGEATDEQIEKAKTFIGTDFSYEDLANYREENDIIALLQDAEDEAIDKSKLPAATSNEGTPIDISDDDLPF